MTKQLPSKKVQIDLLVVLLVLIVLSIFYVIGRFQHNNKTPATTTTKQTFDKAQYSLSDPSSIWVVINKLRPISSASYVPNMLVTPNVSLHLGAGNPETEMQAQAALALQSMFAAANKQNINLELESAYRSYGYQISLYNGYVATENISVAEQQIARPGYSEDQTGYTADVAPNNGNCALQVCFANTAQGKWLTANAYKYGFIIRYPYGKQNITGFTYQPWHIRYVGEALANQIYSANTTMEQFFNLPAAPNYKT